jgi:hypothetical protein
MKKTLIQSTEFNLQLVSGTISQNIAYLDTLCDWCCSDDHMLSFLRNQDSTSGDAIDIYNGLSAQYQNNRVSEYIQRLVITDAKFTKVLQVGKSASDSNSVTIYNVQKFFPVLDNKIHAWDDIKSDPFNWNNDPRFPGNQYHTAYLLFSKQQSCGIPVSFGRNESDYRPAERIRRRIGQRPVPHPGQK